MTKGEAMTFIEEKLHRINELEKNDLMIDAENVTEIRTHWIIPYQSKRFLNSADDQHAIIGIVPYAIDKETGKIDPEIDTSWM